MRFILVPLLLLCLAWAEHLLIETEDKHDDGSDSNKGEPEFDKDYSDDTHYYSDYSDYYDDDYAKKKRNAVKGPNPGPNPKPNPCVIDETFEHTKKCKL